MKRTKILFFTFSSVFTANGVHHSNRPMLEKDDLTDGHWSFLSQIERYDFSERNRHSVYCQLHWYIVFQGDLHENLSNLSQIKNGVNFTELEILFRGKSWKKLNLLSYHGENKAYHFTRVKSKVVSLNWNQ